MFSSWWKFGLSLYMSLLNLLSKGVFDILFLLLVHSSSKHCMSSMCQTLQMVSLLTFLYFFRGRVWVAIGGSKLFSVGQRLGVF